MVQLNVEVTKGSEIRFEDERYFRVAPPARKGDIVKVVEPWGSQVEDAHYPVIGTDHYLFREGLEDYVFIDGEVGHASAKCEKVIIYRKESELLGIKKGTKVEIVDDLLSGGDYEVGDVFTVTGVHRGLLYGTPMVSVEGREDLLTPDEYKVIEVPAADDDIKPGTKIVITKPWMSDGDYTEGDVLTVVKHTKEDKMHVEHVNVEETDLGILREEFEVIKTEKCNAVEGELILITNANPLNDQTYKDGDVLTVTKSDVFLPGDVNVKGQEGIIVNEEYEVILEGAEHFGQDEEDTVAVPEPVAKVGDTVKATKAVAKPYSGYEGEYIGWGVIGQGLVSPGATGKVVRVTSDGDVYVKLNVSDLTVSAQDVDQFLLKHGEYEVKTGRFNVGDIVLVNNGWETYYGEVIEERYSDGEYLIDKGEVADFVPEDDLELIAPKENRVD